MGHLVNHLVRRGVEHFNSRQDRIAQLQKDAADMELHEILPVIITGFLGLLLIWSIHYTIGQVVSSLCMIESPSRTAIVESKPAPPPPYTDGISEKEPLMLEETEPTDVEVVVIEHKPITASIPTTIGHLHRTGGFTARWRGLRLSILYHFLHNLLASGLAAVLGCGIVGEAFMSILVSLGLARLHMAWTHKMIAHPSTQPFWRRLPARKDCKRLLLPAFVYAAAQQASVILPIGVALALGLVGPEAQHHREMAKHCPKALMMLFVRLGAVGFTYALVGLAILLPASVTLTRIEATLLPEGEEPIVPFDKDAVMNEIDTSVKGGCRALFVQAWRSFDRPSRWRLIKLYAKMYMAQFTVAFVAVHLMAFEVYMLGSERMVAFLKSLRAQMRLMAMQAREAHHARVEGN